uniref:Uncharacterized protein n=1 Tax=Daphnia magna TaxID=35525 RepID=A0A0P5DYM4_9CRUS
MMWNNDLRVTFCTKSSTLKKWLLIPYTLLINILSCLDVINCIYHKVQSSPKIIVEEFFIFLSNSQF